MELSENFRYYLLYTILYGVVLLIGEGLFRYLKLNPARTRNLAHFFAGLISLPYPWLFDSHWWVLLIAIQSSLVLYITRYFGLIPSHHQSAGKGLGSFLFFGSLYICFTVSHYAGESYLYVIPVTVLTLSDVLASVIGQQFGMKTWSTRMKKRNSDKTPAGSIAFFLSALVIVFVLLSLYYEVALPRSLVTAMLVSTLATFSEAVSPNGFDNLSVPLISLIILLLLR